MSCLPTVTNYLNFTEKLIVKCYFGEHNRLGKPGTIACQSHGKGCPIQQWRECQLVLQEHFLCVCGGGACLRHFVCLKLSFGGL